MLQYVPGNFWVTLLVQHLRYFSIVGSLELVKESGKLKAAFFNIKKNFFMCQKLVFIFVQLFRSGNFLYWGKNVSICRNESGRLNFPGNCYSTPQRFFLLFRYLIQEKRNKRNFFSENHHFDRYFHPQKSNGLLWVIKKFRLMRVANFLILGKNVLKLVIFRKKKEHYSWLVTNSFNFFGSF